MCQPVMNRKCDRRACNLRKYGKEKEEHRARAAVGIRHLVSFACVLLRRCDFGCMLDGGGWPRIFQSAIPAKRPTKIAERRERESSLPIKRCQLFSSVHIITLESNLTGLAPLKVTAL